MRLSKAKPLLGQDKIIFLQLSLLSKKQRNLASYAKVSHRFETAPPRNIKEGQLQSGWILFFACASAGAMRLGHVEVIKANDKSVVALAKCLLLL